MTAAQVVNIDMSGSGPLVAARSAYLAQVRRIAPPTLVGRQQELAELAGFCLDEQRGPYVWWQAGPWAGKSALLSTFVLDPPERVRARVRVVAFFITARLAGQDTRAAFTAALTEQLSAMTGQQPSTAADEGLREAWLLDLLAQAAEACRQQGARLVLLVDGLDEDRSSTSGGQAHSIAGLLPAVPIAGMRVIVAGRPNPPIPDDVPDWHPLRDRGIVRLLAESPHARNLQRLGRAELKRLLNGTTVERDLLGLVTAARGGLSGPDLRELTGAGLLQIEDVLHTVAGRTFTRRDAHWAPESGPQVYLLGHEELQQAARDYLGESRLDDYRARLHIWADAYRDPGEGCPAWPVGTPEYLLRGYPRMLADTRDVPRLVALATDSGRHDRMLDLTGGDAGALEEVTGAQDLVLAVPEPSLVAMALLSVRRNALADRNATIPEELPAVWAQLGQPARAESLARAITSAYRQARALTSLAESVAVTGWFDRAEQIAGAITFWGGRTPALTAVARAVAVAGDPDRAEQIVRAIDDPYGRVLAKAELIRVAAEAGDHGRARRLADAAEQNALAVAGSFQRARELAAVVSAVAATGDLRRAERIAGEIDELYWRPRALTAVVSALAAAGDFDRAERIATGFSPKHQAELLVSVVSALATAGECDRAERIARSIPVSVPSRRTEALTAVVSAAARAGCFDRAARIAESIADSFERMVALTALAEATAVAGDVDRAEQVVRTMISPYQEAPALTAVVSAVAAGGDLDRAERIARTITDPEEQARALTVVARASAVAGDGDFARRLAVEAEQIARAVAGSRPDARPTGTLIDALVVAGDADRAERVAWAVIDPFHQEESLILLVRAVAGTGDVDRAEHITRASPDLSDESECRPRWSRRWLSRMTPIGPSASPGQSLIRTFKRRLWTRWPGWWRRPVTPKWPGDWRSWPRRSPGP